MISTISTAKVKEKGEISQLTKTLKAHKIYLEKDKLNKSFLDSYLDILTKCETMFMESNENHKENIINSNIISKKKNNKINRIPLSSISENECKKKDLKKMIPKIELNQSTSKIDSDVKNILTDSESNVSSEVQLKLDNIKDNIKLLLENGSSINRIDLISKYNKQYKTLLDFKDLDELSDLIGSINGIIVSKDKKYFTYLNSINLDEQLNIDFESKQSHDYTSTENNQIIPGKYLNVNPIICQNIPTSFQNGILIAHIISQAKTESGSRYLQAAVSQCDKNDFCSVFNEVLDDFHILMCDVFGNHLCQKIFLRCDSNQISEIIERISPTITSIACNRSGACVLQRIVQKYISKKDRELVLKSIVDPQHVLLLIHNSYGIYVLFAIMSHFPYNEISFLIYVAINSFYHLSKVRCGIPFIKKCLLLCSKYENSNINSFNKNRQIAVNSKYTSLTQKIFCFSNELINDIHGNYIIQCLIEIGHPNEVLQIHNLFSGSYFYLARQKCSTFVIEKLMENLNWNSRAELINELIDSPNFGILLSDRYGNYVVQKALSLCLRTQIPRLISALRPFVRYLDFNLQKKWNGVLDQASIRLKIQDKYVVR